MLVALYTDLVKINESDYESDVANRYVLQTSIAEM